MPKKTKEINPYFSESDKHQETIEEMMKRKKQKEREKRIKQRKQEELKKEEKDEKFELDTDSVINMTNRNKIKKDEEQRKKISKQEKKRRKRLKKIKFFLKMFLLIGIIVGSCVFAFTSPIFNIKNINVVNNVTIPSDTIISLSGLKTDENIFKFYKGNVIQKIKENPYVENIEIHRKLPSTIEIDVTERVATYNIDYMGKYAYINTQGYILEISEDSKNMPIIQGATTKEEEIVPGKRLNNEDLKKLEEVIKIMNSAKEAGIDGQVETIDISDEKNYSIYLRDEKKRVYLGDSSNLSNKMLYVQSIIEKEKDKEGDIFVNGDLNNGFHPYFREKV